MLSFEGQKTKFLCIALFASVLPHLGLDYQYETHSGLSYRVPGGQYYFFFGSLFLALALFVPRRGEIIRDFRFEKQIFVSIGLIFLGCLLSNSDLGDWRLFFIVFLLSLSAIFGGYCLQRLGTGEQFLFLIALIAPFALVLFGSMLIGLGHTFGLGLSLNLMTEGSSTWPRWHFLNMSPNGYGFDVAVCGAFSYAIARERTLSGFFQRHRWFWWFTTLLAVSGLIFSGTRAGYLLFICFVLANEILFFDKRVRLFLIVASCFLLFCGIFWLDIFEIRRFLRIQETLALTSSGRLDAVLLMIEKVAAEPFHGVGFGGADNSRFGFVPTNSLYPALALELGIIGFMGAVMFMILPIAKILKSFIRNPNGRWSAEGFPLFERVSICFLIGIIGYEFFEFDVFRVSVTNQLFMLCWSVLYFKAAQTTK